jgi:hypothetical protein
VTNLKRICQKIGQKIKSLLFGHVHNRNVFKQGKAVRVLLFDPFEDGSFIDEAHVSLFQNGIVHIKSKYEEVSSHIQNCEILWEVKPHKDARPGNLKLVDQMVDQKTDQAQRNGTPTDQGLDTV